MKMKRRLIVVECGGAHVAVGLFSVEEEVGGPQRGGLRLVAYGREGFVCPPAQSATWTAQVGAALGVVVERLGLRLGGECRLSLPGHLVLTRRVKTPIVADGDLAQAFRFEAAQVIPFPLDKVAWDAQEIGRSAEEITLLIGAARLDGLEPLCAAVEAVGLSPVHCELGVLAFVRGFELVAEKVAEPVLLVDVGARVTQVMLGGGGDVGVFPLRTLSLGGNAVTEAIAQELDCGFAEAESAKLLVSRNTAARSVVAPLRESEAALGKVVRSAVAVFSKKLAAELMLTHLGYSRQSRAAESSLKRVVLCGGGSGLPGLSEAINAVLALPVEMLTPHEGDGPEPIPANEYGTLYGLALGAELPTAGAGAALNLLPESRRAAHAAYRRRSWGLAAAALLAFLPLAALIPQRVALAKMRARVAAVEAEAAPLVRLSASNTAAQAQLAGLQGHLVQWEALNAGRVRWLGFLGDLQARLAQVGDVWLERFYYTPAEEGEAESTEGSIVDSGRVEVGGWVLESWRSDEVMQQLFDALNGSDFVAGVERERYDRSRAGVIRFDAELLINPKMPL